MAVKSNFASGDVLTASDVNTYLTNGGLVYLGVLTWTNTTAASLDSIFTSTYKNYRLIGNASSASTLNVLFNFRSGGSDTGAGNYKYSSSYLAWTTTTWTGGGNSTTANNISEFGRIIANTEGAFSWDIYGPQTSNITTMVGSSTDADIVRYAGGVLNATTACDGFKLSTSSNSTGVCRVYGYRQA